MVSWGPPLPGGDEQVRAMVVRVKIKGIHFYSCYAPPGVEMEEFENFLDRLVNDVKQHSPAVISMRGQLIGVV